MMGELRTKKGKFCEKVIASRGFDDYYDVFGNRIDSSHSVMARIEKVQGMVSEWMCEQCGGMVL